MISAIELGRLAVQCLQMLNDIDHTRRGRSFKPEVLPPFAGQYPHKSRHPNLYTQIQGLGRVNLCRRAAEAFWDRLRIATDHRSNLHQFTTSENLAPFRAFLVTLASDRLAICVEINERPSFWYMIARESCVPQL